MDEIKQRFAEALASDNDEYIAEFTKGRQAASEGDSLTEHVSQGMQDGFNSAEEAGVATNNVPPVSVGLHPLGGIAIQVTSVTGETSQARITVEEAWNMVGHVNALTGMLIQAAYVQQVTEAQNAQKLIVPGSRNG